MKKLCIFTLIGVFAIFFANALNAQTTVPQQPQNDSFLSGVSRQKITYKFKIVDESGLPISGASVVYKAFWSSVGTISDIDGNATLTVDDSKPTFIISFIGYKSVEITVSGTNQLTIVLKEDTPELEK